MQKVKRKCPVCDHTDFRGEKILIAFWDKTVNLTTWRNERKHCEYFAAALYVTELFEKTILHSRGEAGGNVPGG